MDDVQYIFKNKGLGTYNDEVYTQVFDILNNEFTIRLKPNARTKFWRFGIALSTKKEFKFHPMDGRYNNSELKFIEIDVGELNKTWYLENRLALGARHIDGFEGYPKIHNNYIPFSTVQLVIKFDSNKNVYVSYASENISGSEHFPIKGYRYFKIFAWADEAEFELACEIEITNKRQKTVIPKVFKKSSDKTYSEISSQLRITDEINPVIEVIELAAEIGELLKLLKDPKGNMFGIFGKWGRGKTFLWKKIVTYLNENSTKGTQFIKVEFHAWKYQDTPASWAYLYETLADKYFEGNKILKFFKKIKLNFIRKGYLGLTLFILGFILFSIWLFIPFELKFELVKEWIIAVASITGIIGLIKIIYLYIVYKPKAINILSVYSEKVSFKEYLGLQAEIQKEIILLMKCWISENKIDQRKILLFVDDIDRCSESKIIQVVDSLKVMLEDAKIAKRITVLAALDERVLKMAINVKYRDLLTNSSIPDKEHDKILNGLTKEYIDKLFISGVKLGELTIIERNQIFDSITENKIGDIPNSDDQIISNNLQVQQIKSTSIAGKASIVKPVDNTTNTEGKEINRSEYELLITALEKYSEVTPRTIRIYYYRYLLAKKIMKYKIKEGSDIYNEWTNLNKDKSILPLLIIHYSISIDAKELENELNTLERITTKKVKKEVFNTQFEIPKGLYKELLRIVEMVVPY